MKINFMKNLLLSFLLILSFNYSYTQSADILLNGTVSAENNQIKNVAVPTDASDAVNLEFLQNEINNSDDSYSQSIGLTGFLFNNYDGKSYRTVTMCDGNQWTIDFLRSTHFNNGDEIPLVQDNTDWMNLTSSGRSYYQHFLETNLPITESAAENYIGFIYNWFVVEDERGIAPDGWRVATKDDWDNIIECLGGQEVAGGKIKITPYYASLVGYYHNYSDITDWVNGDGNYSNVGSSITGNATNSSGLSLKPYGSREGANGIFYSWGEHVVIWANSDESQPRVEVFGNSAGVLPGLTDPYDGYYILLVKE